MKLTYKVPLGVRGARVTLRSLFRGIFRVLSPIKITGLENVPRRQPYIVAVNHVSLYDPPFVVAFWPETLEVMGAIDVWEKPGQNVLARLYGGIPVHRGDYDRVLMDTVLQVLRSGRPLLIAPEGGRSHVTAMQRAKPGVAFILERTRAPVVPVGIVGTTDDYWQLASHGKRPRLELRIGQPIRLPLIEGKGTLRRQARQSNADLVMSHIAGLLPEAYRGVYANSAILPNTVGANRGRPNSKAVPTV
jgi:1-acyl-sn-glycerol-3-phosphate acyltransferase